MNIWLGGATSNSSFEVACSVYNPELSITVFGEKPTKPFLILSLDWVDLSYFWEVYELTPSS